MTNNRLCKVLGIEKPIIQGPMAWVSTAPLVAAVSENGGLGVLGVGNAEFVREQIIATRKMTSKPFGINIFMVPGMVDNLTKIALEEKPSVIYADTLLDLDLELSKKYFSVWKEAGLKIIVKASNIKDAKTAEKAGADVVIVKGWEGGGHTTYEATTVLIPQAADCLSIPVVGSGGNVKQAMLKAGDMETVITGISTDEPCRQLKNKLSDEMITIESNYIKKVIMKQ